MVALLRFGDRHAADVAGAVEQGEVVAVADGGDPVAAEQRAEADLPAFADSDAALVVGGAVQDAGGCGQRPGRRAGFLPGSPDGGGGAAADGGVPAPVVVVMRVIVSTTCSRRFVIDAFE